MQELLDYIQAARKAGQKDEEIKQILKNTGWDDGPVAQAFLAAPAPLSVNPTEPVPANLGANIAPTANGLLVKIRALWKQFWIVIVTVLVLAAVGASGYFAYSRLTNTPDKIWNNLTKNMFSVNTAHFLVESSYTDEAPKASGDSKDNEFLTGFLGNVSKIEVTMGGEGNLIMQKDNPPDYEVSSKVKLKFGSMSFEVEGESKKIGDIVYYKIGDNPFLALLGAFAGDGAGKYDWMKMNLKEQVEKNSALQTITAAQTSELAKAYEAAKLLKPAKFINEEKLGDVNTLHFQAELDKTGIKDYFTKIFNVFEIKNSGQIVDALLEKLVVSKIEMWVGKKDNRLYKAIIESNAPSAFSLFNSSTKTATAISRDAKRVADVRQIMTALELFYNDNNRYPASADGKPSYTDGSPKMGSYMAAYPAALTPADGSCSNEQNNYTYKQTEGGKNYELTFCLGKVSGGLGAGINTATSAGMNNNSGQSVYTPYTPPTEEEKTAEAIETIKNLDYTAKLNMKMVFSDYDKPIKIDVPQNALDVNELQRNQKDAASASSIRWVLDSYFFDNKRYPDGLVELKKNRSNIGAGFVYPYITDLPNAVNTTGVCSAVAGDFNYKALNGGASYSFEFCLTQETQGYQAGVHQVTPAGIQ